MVKDLRGELKSNEMFKWKVKTSSKKKKRKSMFSEKCFTNREKTGYLALKAVNHREVLETQW